jgi:hypothetical protein
VQRLIASCLNDACRRPALIDESSYPAETEGAIIRPPRRLRCIRRFPIKPSASLEVIGLIDRQPSSEWAFSLV